MRRPSACRPTTSRSSSTTGTWRITHVFRGDEHVNNTPWQINIFRALGAPLPHFGHCPIILGDDGQKLSQAPRRGQRDGLRGRRLPARGDAELPGAPGLEPRRRRALHARADGAVVRRQPPGEEPGAVGPGQAGVGQRALHQAGRRRAPGRAGAAAARQRAASRWPISTAWRAPAPCSRTAAARWSSWPTGSRCIFVPVPPRAEDRAAHRHRRRCGRRCAALRERFADRRLGQGGHRRGDQGDARRTPGSRCRSSRRRCACSSAAARRRRRSTPCWRCSRARRCSRACSTL